MSVIIDGYTIDAAVQEDLRFSSDISEFPVEEGPGVTDHVRNRPKEVTIEGVVSDTSLRPVADTRGILSLPSEEFLARLELIHEFRDPVTIETTQRVFDDMVLKDLSIPRDARTGDALSFRATFQQVELVSTDRFEINVEIPRAKPLRKFGAKAPRPANPAAQVLTQVADVVDAIFPG
jgi:hypothetical protein